MATEDDKSPLGSLPGNDIDIRFTSESFATSIKLEWAKPETVFEHFEVRYKEEYSKIKFKTEETDSPTIELENLKSSTSYDIIILTSNDGMPKEYMRKKCKTIASPAAELQKYATCIDPTDKQIRIYKIKPFKTHAIDDIRLCEMWYGPDLSMTEDEYKERNVIFLGSTGAGKSTLIDALFNYIANVPFSDEYRYKLIDLTNEERKAKEVDSTTSGITCYRLRRKEGLNLDWKILNVIDTPGFNDTRGKPFDKKIPFQLQQLFTNIIESVDAICVVLRSSDLKLTDAQKYVFTSISKLFGKDINRNIFPFITFDDGGEGKNCLEALKEAKIPFNDERCFRFSNSDIFLPTKDDESLKRWQRRRQNFNNFFEALNGVKKQGLEKSKEVLETRIRIKIQLQGIGRTISHQVNQINNITTTVQNIQSHELDLEQNKNFEYCVQVAYTVLDVSNKNCLNCKICEETCHRDCWVYLGFTRTFCEAMLKGKCTVCKGECASSSHVNSKNEYITKYRTEIRTQKDILKKYKVASMEARKHKEILESEKEELRDSLKSLSDTIKGVKKLNKKLQEIALKPDEEGVKHYIEELVKDEIQNNYDGYVDRIRILKMIIGAIEREIPFSDMVNEIIGL